MTERSEAASCFCGRVTATFHGEPFWIGYDHDEDCRKATGGPLALWVGYRPHQVRFLSGEPKSFSRTKGIVRTFCGTCGTSISYADEGLADQIYFTVGFLDHPQRFAPEAHAYWKERLPFVDFADDLPRVDGYSQPRDPQHGSPKSR